MDTDVHEENAADGNKREIQNTAFWMAGCRAAITGLSRDIYADLWLNLASRAKHKEYTTLVSPTENIALSLRCRFFLEEVSSYLRQHPDAVFVNIGAGFCSYPFLLPEGSTCIEVDTPENVRLKQEKISVLASTGLLPAREITFYSADLEDVSQIDALRRTIKSYVGQRPSFILYEGLIYYLPVESIQGLFELAADIQVPGSRMGVNSWNPEAEDYPVYHKFKEYFRTLHGKEPPSFVCHDPDEFRRIPEYALLQQTNYMELSHRFEMVQPLQPDDDVFWETLSVLEKE